MGIQSCSNRGFPFRNTEPFACPSQNERLCLEAFEPLVTRSSESPVPGGHHGLLKNPVFFGKLHATWVLLPVGSRVDRTNELARTNAERTKPEEKFKSLLQSAPDAMVIVKQEGEIVLVNSQTEKLFGYSPEELLSKKVQILLVLNEPPPARRT